jgi:hypothetical protein
MKRFILIIITVLILFSLLSCKVTEKRKLYTTYPRINTKPLCSTICASEKKKHIYIIAGYIIIH